MSKQTTVSRTGLLRFLTVGTLVRLGASAGLFASQRLPVPASESPDVIMVIRHAEKPMTSGPPYGVTADGVADEHSLTVAGWVRAGALAVAFSSPERWGVPVPRMIYASSPRDDVGFRAEQTVAPLAKRLDLTVDTSFRRGDEAGLAAELVAGHGARLVSWEHRSIPAIVAGLGTVTPLPANTWAERYDLIWVFTKTTGSPWRFRVIPQHLLGDDSTQA
jgi:hypothetical protein